MKQDHEASEGVMAASWNRGGNMGTQDTMRANSPFLFNEEGMF